MPTLLDPENALPPKKTVSPSQVILLLLYPIIFGVGFAAGLVIGLRQAPPLNTANTNTTPIVTTNARIVPTNTNTSSANVNTPLSNTAIGQGEYLQLDAATVAALNQQEQQDRASVVDQSAAVPDILRQEDVLSLKYNLQAYYSLKKSFPSTTGQQIHLERQADNIFFQAMKEFYGTTYNLRIDPESPTYYYGYASDGQSFELSAWLPSKNKPFILKNLPL